ncbi:MAG TPA: hypothetical protein VIM01_02080 [Dermatophilaceae bacterium]
MKASITHDEKRDATCSQVEKTADQWWTSFNSVIMEIEFMSPGLIGLARQIRGVLAEWEDEVDDHFLGGLALQMDAFNDGMEALQEGMRSELSLQPKVR